MKTTLKLTGVFISLFLLLVALFLAGLVIGSKPTSFAEVAKVFSAQGSEQLTDLVLNQRLPRTLIALITGIALGVAGIVMQLVGKNPLADPGILGINAGAALSVAISMAVFGMVSLNQIVWFAILGAFLASAIVYLLASGARSAASPGRLILAGTALTAVLLAMTNAVVLYNPQAFDIFRFWTVGGLEGRNWETFSSTIGFFAGGLILAFLCWPSFNALDLGDDSATQLGVKVGLVKTIGILSMTMLCGAAVAAVGPISFLALAVPHLAKALVGPDYRLIVPMGVLVGPIFMLSADLVGRVIARPAEVEVGIVVAVIGAPIFIYQVLHNRKVQRP